MTETPHRWSDLSVGDLCEFKYGRALSAGARIDGSVPVYGSNGIVGWHNDALTSGPTIVIGRKGSLGKGRLLPSVMLADRHRLLH